MNLFSDFRACVYVIKNMVLKLSFIFFISILPFHTAFAFKVDTHVWVGQQVINDLSDGKLTFKVGRKKIKISVDPIIVNAIKQNPDIFRMGNIGPDASPGILAGQMVVHPGNAESKGNWEADDWLRWLLQGAKTPEEIAYVYGYLGHASADVFSHTYVNQVSGDIFALFDGEIEVEKRHIALEKYIADKTPPLSGAGRTFVGKAYDVINVPTNFVLERLIMNSTVETQYRMTGMYHLSGVHKLRTNLQETIDGPIKLLENEFAKYVITQASIIPLNDKDIAKIRELEAKIRAELNSGLSNLQNLSTEFTNLLTETTVSASQVVIDVLNAKDNLIDLNRQLDDALRNINTAQQELVTIPIEIVKRVCKDVCRTVRSKECVFLACDVVNKTVCDNICSNVTVVNDAWTAKNKLVTDLLTLRDNLRQKITDAKTALNNAVTAAANAEVAARQAINDAISAAIELIKRYAISGNPIRAILEGWILDINTGMKAYIIANQDAIKNSMRPKGDILKPMVEWLDCWGLAITAAMPAPITNIRCKTKNRILDITTELVKLETEVANLAGDVFPLQKAINQIKQKLLFEVKKAVKELAIAFVSKITGTDIQELVKLFSQPVDKISLNNLFSNAATAKNLLVVGDIAQRVDSDMKLTASGNFNPKKFNVAFNAVVLAKLSLLNEVQLNLLASKSGVVNSTVYGTTLYSGTSASNPVNILVNAIRSLDGNHQWMEKSPPYPRRIGSVLDDRLRKFGYSALDGKGFRFWQDRVARKKIFYKIFKGPLSPSIEKPLGVRRSNFVEVFDPRYQYRSCKSRPFPDLLLIGNVLQINDKSCLSKRR